MKIEYTKRAHNVVRIVEEYGEYDVAMSYYQASKFFGITLSQLRTKVRRDSNVTYPHGYGCGIDTFVI